MPKEISAEELVALGLDAAVAGGMADRVNSLLRTAPAAQCWRVISQQVLRPCHPFPVHRFLYETVFADWDNRQGPRPAWSPTEESQRASNLGRLMETLGFQTYDDLRRWSCENRQQFWELMVEQLGIRFSQAPSQIMDPLSDVACPRWLVDARLNIVDSCFGAPADATAIICRTKSGATSTWSYGELLKWTNRVASGLVESGFEPGDAIGVCLPMTAESVAIYLGIIKAGCVAVSIADSFAPEGIAARLKLGQVKGVFTQDYDVRGRKPRPLYERVVRALAPTTVVVPSGDPTSCELRETDRFWEQFLGSGGPFESVGRAADDHTNILFSSGTTDEPKAIPWTQTTPIKCAADAYLHHDIRPGDVLAWPTNLGWMMGPWLIYASLINRASMALYHGAPTGRGFCEFVQDAKVTMLGVVPSLVKAWRNAGCADGLDWSSVKAFSSTGECSYPDDMLYLMSLAGYRPIIEYCGGTEIGGGYITGTVVQPASPSTFSTPALGLDFTILDEDGAEYDNGELFLIPPSIGLSNELLNRDHHEVYFAQTPQGSNGVRLRRHGDQIERLPGGYYRAHGRVDDTMNLGGIKISSAEVERVLNSVKGIGETGAVSFVPQSGGLEHLVVYVVLEPDAEFDGRRLKGTLQQVLAERLNSLFRIHDLIVVDALPRTESNKMMRRELRRQYLSNHSAR
ncbi:MAG: AMP-binding protein [Planctomycetaceae bacterium]|nr:AMP-binding protein [Planctomycetaceae bacterium]